MISDKMKAHLQKLHEGNRTHGMSKTQLHGIWFSIKQRCRNPNSTFFPYYGGRGIDICDSWANDFEEFKNYMGEKPEGTSIDRIDNSKGYEPGNCRWATKAEQQRNRRNNKILTFNGKAQTAMDWAIELNIPSQTIYNRISLKWPVEKILSADKQMNIAGLSLGGKANGARNSSKTHCKRGHEFTTQNTTKTARMAALARNVMQLERGKGD